MNITGILIATAIVGGAGLLIGIALGFAARIFAVEVDEREVLIREKLPGNNCGGCGYAGCDALAKAIAAGEAPVHGCPVGGADVAAAIGEIMGTTAKVTKMVAFVKCRGNCNVAVEKYEYKGSMNCREAAIVSGGPKGCVYGCMGLGSCVQVCDFDAISVVDGIAQVDPEKCAACQKCISWCPKKLIALVPYEQVQRVQCSSKEKGKDVKQVCKVGCIGCKLCERSCEYDAIHVIDNVAEIDYTKCTGCGKCAEKCPSKIITMTQEEQ